MLIRCTALFKQSKFFFRIGNSLLFALKKYTLASRGSMIESKTSQVKNRKLQKRGFSKLTHCQRTTHWAHWMKCNMESHWKFNRTFSSFLLSWKNAMNGCTDDTCDWTVETIESWCCYYCCLFHLIIAIAFMSLCIWASCLCSVDNPLLPFNNSTLAGEMRKLLHYRLFPITQALVNLMNVLYVSNSLNIQKHQSECKFIASKKMNYYMNPKSY